MDRQREEDARTDLRTTQLQTTHFQLFTGPGTAFPHNDRVVLGTGILPTDFLFAEAARDVPWTKPADMVIQPDEPLPLPSGTVLMGLADGTVRAIDRDGIADSTLRWYLRPNDGPAPPLD